MRYDLVVVGGGPGGYAAAIRASQLGLRTALVERDAVGGTCLNRGCIPTKTLLHSAHLYREMLTCQSFGLQAEGVRFDYGAMSARKDEVTGQLRSGVEGLLKGNKVELLRGSAQVEEPGKVRVGEEVLESRHILIATGAVPAKPPVPGLDLPGVVTSDELLADGRLYPRLTIVGGGVIGMEFACLCSALGTEVTVIEAMDRILPTLDRELGQNLAMLLKKRGVRVHTGAVVERVERQGEALTCTFTAKGKAERAQSDAVLVATGRRPNTAGLFSPRLEDALGLDRGGIPVNLHFSTRVAGICAIGDVVKGNIQLAHVASAQGINAVSRMAGLRPPMRLEAVPACVYTDPEIACVGSTEAECKENGIPYKTGKYLMSGNGRTVIARGERGFIKVVYHAESGAVLGAQLMCERATDLIGEFTLAVAEGRTVERMAQLIRPHPTFGEGISEAAESCLGLAIHQLNR